MNHRPTPRPRRRALTLLFAAALFVIGSGVITTGAAAEAGAHSSPTRTRPTVVLVHGAWADSSSWDGVVSRLLHDGYPVDVFPTPLRSLAGDTAVLRTYLEAISGPVVLVGHSYGGAVVTDAATGEPGVRALVYIDAFAPELGESVLALPGAASALANPDPTKVFRFVPASLPPTAATDLYILPAVFPGAFANDLPQRRAAVLAATQRPVTLGALSEPSTQPAWKTIPSWYQVGTADKVITPDQQRMMAQRANAHTVEVKSGHLPMISHPTAVTRLIERAARATSS